MARESIKMTEQKGSDKVNPDQDAYDIFVAQGIKLASAVSEKLQGSASIDVLGNALFEIVNKIETEGEKNGVKFDLSVLLHGSNEILGHLIDMSQVEISEEQVKAVVGIAVGKYLNNAVKTGKMTPDQVVQLSEAAKQNMPQQGGAGLVTPQMSQGGIPGQGV
jgi:hypothetical protein